MLIAGISSDFGMRLARYQAQAQQAADTAMAHLASGRRFISFAEDPVAATREISLRAQQGAVGIYLRTTQDAAAAADAASAGLKSAYDILTEMRNDVLDLDPSDPDAVQQSIAALRDELTRIGQTTTTADGTELLDGSIDSTPLTFTVAGTGSASDQVQLSAIKVDASELGSDTLKLTDIDFTSGVGATDPNDALAAIDAAQDAIAESLASTGAVSSAMNFHAGALGQQVSGIDSVLHNLVDVDDAQESVNLITAQIREQFAAAALAQANTLQLSMVRQLLMTS